MCANRFARLLLFQSVLFALLVGFPTSSGAQTQSPFLGSVPTGQVSATPLKLSLQEAFDRALKYNLGAIESDQQTRAAHAVRLRGLNALLPNLTARVNYALQTIDLRSEGINLNIPGVSFPAVVGPFAVEDARGSLSQEIFDWSDIQRWKSASASERASQYTYRSDRDLVILTAGNAYLLVISDAATVDSTRAQVKTAGTLYNQDVDRGKQGVIASIDVLRSQVEFATQQQRLIAAENQLDIDKLALARIIGLPNGQEFQVTDTIPYLPLQDITLDQALQEARSDRPDYLSAESQVHAAELAKGAAAAENYPSLTTDANYGNIGSPNWGASQQTFAFEVGVNVPIFQGSRVRADKLEADSDLVQRQAELADLGGKIDAEVRTAFYNLKSSSELVSVARNNVDLANQTLTQAQDRFSAGVADNLEVVQAQESVASANQSYIASLYSFNLAKISLAQALGTAEKSALQYLLGGK